MQESFVIYRLGLAIPLKGTQCSLYLLRLTRRPCFWEKELALLEVCYLNLEQSSCEEVHRLLGDHLMCFSIMSLRYSIKERPVAAEATVIGSCVHDCTFIKRATRQGKYLRIPNPYIIASSPTSSSGSDMTFRRVLSIATP